ncbi:hypothetical protein CHS0354_034981 [Potamilus streckersoni]|uniref:Uncharacterized protein n=1 Tax=Potamilus streckersoni TaxID=2493646 RepID=A0AAE0SDK1_9BIVA|nr:hypothetical protein CHS0354_034981 [Potamilus streckersoni]
MCALTSRTWSLGRRRLQFKINIQNGGERLKVVEWRRLILLKRLEKLFNSSKLLVVILEKAGIDYSTLQPVASSAHILSLCGQADSTGILYNYATVTSLPSLIKLSRLVIDATRVN